jgi:hypothetical protein
METMSKEAVDALPSNVTAFSRVSTALRLCTGRTAHRGIRGTSIALPFFDYDTRRGEESASPPGRSLPPGKIWYPLYRRLGGP